MKLIWVALRIERYFFINLGWKQHEATLSCEPTEFGNIVTFMVLYFPVFYTVKWGCQ